ncbi:MAG: hypothetical protein R3E12_16850 [Candidatus Eisenbacteria bacterium]
MNPGWLPTIVFSPLIAAFVLLFVPARQRIAVRVISIGSTVVSLVGSLIAARAYDQALGGYQFRWGVPIIPSAGVRLDFGLDGWGVSLLLLTSLIIFAGTWATWNLRDRDKDFYILLLTLVAGVYGVFVSLDLFMFFLFYEIAKL